MPVLNMAYMFGMGKTMPHRGQTAPGAMRDNVGHDDMHDDTCDGAMRDDVGHDAMLDDMHDDNVGHFLEPIGPNATIM